MKVLDVTLLNVSNLQDSFAWFEQVGGRHRISIQRRGVETRRPKA